MIETTVAITGMVCGMCESHINDAIRRAFPVRKVTASRSRGCARILSEQPLEPEALRRCIDATGYQAGDISTRSVEKTGLLARLRK